MACSTTKKKPRPTKAPKKVRTLDSFRRSDVKLSKETEKQLRMNYNLRKRSKYYEASVKKHKQIETSAAKIKSGAGTKKVTEPKLSEKTMQKINLAYRRRKTKPRREKREAKREAFRKANAKFIVGETYETFFIVDSESILRYKVIGRTAQFVTLQNLDNKRRIRCKVHLWDGCEACYPDGRYSMCPVLESTDRVSRPKVPEGTTVTAKLPGRRG